MRVVPLLIVVAIVAGAPFDAAAEPARRQGSDESARLQQMLQQLNSEKTKLSSENAKLQAELEKIKADLQSATKERDTGAQKLGRAASDLANTQAKATGLQSAFDTLKARFDQLVAQYRQTVDVMKGLEAERNGLKSMTADFDARVTTCERNNDALYKASLELIDLYEHKGAFASLLQHESITGLKRVEIENLMDQYRQLADDMHLKYAAPATEPVDEPADDARSPAPEDQSVTKASQ